MVQKAANFSSRETVINNTRHPLLIPLDPQYAPKAEWKETAFPDLNVLGKMPKAGTSQFYSILSTHSDAVPFHPNK